MIVLAHPQAAWLLLLPLLVYYILPAAAKMYGDALKVPFVADLQNIKDNLPHKLGFTTAKIAGSVLKKIGMALLWCLIVIALCRPQVVGEPKRVDYEGRDILLAVDISNSMRERDFQYQNKVYDRLSAVKSVVSRFIDERPDDRMGLVVFGTRAYMQVPLTYDKYSLKEVLQSLDAGMAGNSTSIGDALGVALKNLAAEGTNSQNKVIILLTDGENNDGALSFPQAIKLAQQEQVKIYTIGVGSDTESFFGGLFNIPVNSGLDEASLQQLAEVTKGAYFRAKDFSALSQIYEQINKLEVQEQHGRFVQETKELFYYPAAAALLLFWLLIALLRKDW